MPDYSTHTHREELRTTQPPCRDAAAPVIRYTEAEHEARSHAEPAAKCACRRYATVVVPTGH
jgi:hypothetical protein